MIGIITCKKRQLNSDPYTYGELYIHDVVVTVKKVVYDTIKVGDEVEFSYTDHVSFSGVQFHNLTDIKKIGKTNYDLDFESSFSLSQQEKEFFSQNRSKFFFWIKVAFFSLVLFFVEMYFVARFELDLKIQQSTGKSYLLILMFLFLFTLNFLALIPVFNAREKSKLQKLLKFVRRVQVIEFVQASDNCDFYYQDLNGTGNTQITMQDFHKVKNNPVLELSFINNELFYQVSVAD